MAIFEKAKNEVGQLIARVMEQYHGELHEAGVTLDVLMASPTTNKNGEATGPPLKRNGYPCAAIIKIVGLPDRTAGLGDAMLKIDADEWEKLNDKQRAALVDHELTHLIVKTDKDGNTKTDDLGRPKLQIRRHDREVSWFDEVVRRHERDAMEYAAFDSICKQIAQMELPFMRQVG